MGLLIYTALFFFAGFYVGRRIERHKQVQRNTAPLDITLRDV